MLADFRALIRKMPNWITSESLKITGPNLLGPHFSVSLSNQAVWPVIFGLTGPICARAPKVQHGKELSLRGHHDWPVKPTI
jgi:hypothetical protein